MITLHQKGMYLIDGVMSETADVSAEEARKATMTYACLTNHNTSGNDSKLKIKFDKE